MQDQLVTQSSVARGPVTVPQLLLGRWRGAAAQPASVDGLGRRLLETRHLTLPIVCTGTPMSGDCSSMLGGYRLTRSSGCRIVQLPGVGSLNDFNIR